MNQENLNQPATKGDLSDLDIKLSTEIVKLDTKLSTEIAKLDVKIDEKVDELRGGMTNWKDEILTSNDKVIKKLDQVLTEQQVITINYRRLDHKVENLEDFAEKVSAKLRLDFEKV